ncbi:DUF559 domain-containing protein [Pseudarthrobacter sp. O4]|uniref:DUF559 domain-containing protein n=1 Tax=Pseudarthrobacter sp. O4 TaxID=3418417 RepID=UPI003CF4079E
MQPPTFLASRGGSATAAELLRAGFGRSGISTALSAGTLVRIRRGHYGLPQDSRRPGDISVNFLLGKPRGNRNARARSVLDLVIPRADSLLEVLANVAFVRAGLHVRRHVQIPGVGEVEFLIEDCLVVETDGGTHLEPLQVKKDRKRNNATIVGGHLVLRYGYDDVVRHPGRMVAEVLAVLEQRRGGAAREIQ